MCTSIAAPGAGATRASSRCRNAWHVTGGAALVCQSAPHSRSPSDTLAWPTERPAELGVDSNGSSGLRGRVRGYVANNHLPGWFEPTLLELEQEPFGHSRPDAPREGRRSRRR
jgi:hypothetical protein